jgi:2-dehydro-3-deoxy-D-arabinonate dehydratase
LDNLVAYLAHDNPIRAGTVLLTGTGIVPDDDFTLQAGDAITISAEELGVLRNVCAPASELLPSS